MLNPRNSPRRSVTLALFPLLVFTLITPMTASCQRASSDPDRGIEELRDLVRASSGRPAPSELTRIEGKYPRTRTAALARFLKGYLYYSSQNYKEAIDALDSKSIMANSAIGDYALFYLAESEAAGDSKSARRDYAAIFQDHPESLRARESRLRSASLAITVGEPARAIDEVASLAEANDADALFVTAQAYEAMGKNDQAVRTYRKIYYEIAASNAGVQSESKLSALGAAIKDNPGSFAEERSRADALFQSRQYLDAADAYDKLLSRFPEAESIDEVHLRRGISLMNSKQAATAITSLAKVSDRDPNLKAEALFQQADALRRANRVAESGVIIDRLVSQFSKTRWAVEGLYALANYLNKQEREGEAVSRYRQLATRFPRSSYAPEASYNVGWYAYKTKNYAEAARLLEQHLASYRYPETKFIGEACLWAAKSEERLGHKAKALVLYEMVNARYRYGYHGYIAGQRLAALKKSDPSISSEQPKPGSDLERIRANVAYVEQVQETADGSETTRIAKADDLEVIGLDELAIKELNKALEAAPSSPKLNLRLAQLYSRRGENFQATLILRKGYPDLYSYRDSDLPRQAWEIFFPIVAWSTIKEEAKRYGVDPYIAAGLIRQESVFSPTAISRVGARGLMQVMPATGQLISKRQGTGNITAADLYNPALNVKLGMNYLAQMLGQFGRIEYAAAAYNAGPGRAQRWIAERGGLDIEDWIETIPFSETRGYVQGVIRYAANYRRFYKD